jgi:L-ascorbate metabolism protein UlaG (beta-lactamase superfamily)
MRLVERVRTRSLAAELADPPNHAVRLFWLGQAGFVVDGAGCRAVIDPYLSDSLAEKYAGTRFPHRRLMPVPVAPGLIRHVDAVLATHAHTDHLDGGTLPELLSANPDAVLVAPAASRDLALARSGISPERFRGLDAGEGVDLTPELVVSATRAAHETLERDQDGRHRFLGLALRLGGMTVFHSGDTVPFEGQVDELRAVRAAVALLPVNGRDGVRRASGIPGNMSATDAVTLVRAAGVPAAVLHHFDLFAFNTVPRDQVEAVARAASDLYVAPARLDVVWVLEDG